MEGTRHKDKETKPSQCLCEMCMQLKSSKLPHKRGVIPIPRRENRAEAGEVRRLQVVGWVGVGTLAASLALGKGPLGWLLLQQGCVHGRQAGFRGGLRGHGEHWVA